MERSSQIQPCNRQLELSARCNLTLLLVIHLGTFSFLVAFALVMLPEQLLDFTFKCAAADLTDISLTFSALARFSWV